MSMNTAVLWEFWPDPESRRRLRSRLRFATLALSVLIVATAWTLFEVIGGMVGVAIMLTLVISVESWGKSLALDAEPQRVMQRGRLLEFSGPDLYRRPVDDEAFEHEAGETSASVSLDDLDWISVYPAITRTEQDHPAEFHLVVDMGLRGGDRCCASFNRRIPFRIEGERSLAEVLSTRFTDRWRDPPAEDPFGELDERRLADWDL
jgi:hypothetical protein